MTLKNSWNRIICIGTTPLMPEEEMEITREQISPAVQTLIDMKYLTLNDNKEQLEQALKQAKEAVEKEESAKQAAKAKK